MRDKVTRLCPQTTTFWGERRAEADSNRGPSAYRPRPNQLSSRRMMMMMSWCLMSSDVSWHIRDKFWPMPKHGSINLYVHGNQKARYDGQPRTSTSTLTQLLNYVSPDNVTSLYIQTPQHLSRIVAPSLFLASTKREVAAVYETMAGKEEKKLSLGLFRPQLLKEQLAKYASQLLPTGGVPTSSTLLFSQWLTVSSKERYLLSYFRSCVRVEVAVLGCPS